MQTLKTDTRKRILNVSKRLFLKKGFRETTTRDIAREAGINLSNLYHYFTSKDELFSQLLKPATDTLEAMLNEHHGVKGKDILGMQEEGYVEATLEECLYKHIFSKHGVLERFGPMFCHSDIINYGNLHNIDFIRTRTLCQGGDCCDFRFVKHRRGEVWERTKSI